MPTPRAPQPSALDHAHTAARLIVGEIPTIGSVASELFCSLVAPPLEGRRDDWMNTIASLIDDLSANQITIEQLRDNPEFISSVLRATKISLQTHQQEKLKALRNALFNSVSLPRRSFDVQEIYFQLIDELTPTHMEVLAVACDPERWATQGNESSWAASHTPQQLASLISTNSFQSLISLALPEMEFPLAKKIWKDLFVKGLVEGDDPDAIWTIENGSLPRGSSLGKGLMEFIS